VAGIVSGRLFSVSDRGMLPFIAPHKWREMLANMLVLSDSTIRRIGLASMITGVILLYVVN
jgi:uncharacterized protein YjeT (DUF2065 family)